MPTRILLSLYLFSNTLLSIFKSFTLSHWRLYGNLWTRKERKIYFSFLSLRIRQSISLTDHKFFNFTCSSPSPSPLSYLSKIHFLILSTHLRLGLPSGLFPSGFLTNILYVFLFSSFVLHAPSISSILTSGSNTTELERFYNPYIRKCRHSVTVLLRLFPFFNCPEENKIYAKIVVDMTFLYKVRSKYMSLL
jgi:hypothetical protein